jgi:hypothetical protein
MPRLVRVALFLRVLLVRTVLLRSAVAAYYNYYLYYHHHRLDEETNQLFVQPASRLTMERFAADHDTT